MSISVSTCTILQLHLDIAGAAVWHPTAAAAAWLLLSQMHRDQGETCVPTRHTLSLPLRLTRLADSLNRLASITDSTGAACSAPCEPPASACPPAAVFDVNMLGARLSFVVIWPPCAAGRRAHSKRCERERNCVCM